MVGAIEIQNALTAFYTLESLQRLLVSRASDTECADGIVYSLHRLPVVGATEIQNALTGLYTLQRLFESRATVILNVPMELYNLYTDYWWLVPQRYRMH